MPLLAIVPSLVLRPTVLTVGDGAQFSRIEDAVKAAKSGDRIEVSASAAGYGKAAVLVKTPKLTIVGVGEAKVVLDGEGFEYSGVGSIPRAIFQIDPGADGVTVSHFELRGAHNESHNGAGVRINAAKNVTVSDCDVHGNDMGVMSNGVKGDATAGAGQLFDHSHIHHNGSEKDPGYNHNLYLGGTDATIRFCEIDHSLTGHNLKSRAHFTLVEYCFVHDSANREMDFVEAWDTERANSNAVLIGNVIVKDRDCKGNRGVIHFGRERGVRTGDIYLANNTVVTPFESPVIELTVDKGRAFFYRNVVMYTGQANPTLLTSTRDGDELSASGDGNWFSASYKSSYSLFWALRGFQGTSNNTDPGFAQGDFIIPNQSYKVRFTEYVYRDGEGELCTLTPGYRYIGKGQWGPTKERFIGAG